jgi:hypothetical protein
MAMTQVFKGLALGGSADGLILQDQTEYYRHYLPLELEAIPIGPADFDKLETHTPAYEQYCFIKRHTTDAVNGDVEHGYWVPENKRNEAAHYVLAELTKGYREAREPRKGIHAEIKERCELAQTYAEDGAFYTAGKHLMALGERLVMHAQSNADEIDAARSGEVRHKRRKR